MKSLSDYSTENQFKAQIKKSTRLTPYDTVEVRDLILEVNNGDVEFEAGQSVGVLVPGPHAYGNEVHFRLYTIADLPKKLKSGKTELNLCVRRCNYIDEFSGEEFAGVASNYLCERGVGEEITLSGPYGLPFEVPEDKSSNLLMIGMGTGIAPFRAFTKHIYNNVGDWQGQVRLFYGARTGLELLYMNDKNDDFANYYDEDTFKAFKALSPRPHWDDPIALDYAIEERSNEIWKMLNDSKTYVYIVGSEKIREVLESVFTRMAGSKEKWERKHAELVAGKRWAEILY